MDWFPLLNSLRVALLATLLLFFPAMFAAQRVMRLSSAPLRGVWDVFLSLSLVLPPPVLGWLTLLCFGPNHAFGYWTRQLFGLRLVMAWPAEAVVAALTAFPLLYRVARRSFERFPSDIVDTARTLGRSDAWIFWRIQVPMCRRGIIAGTLLAFGRALGEYGATYMVAGYVPGRTATVATSVYRFWSGGDDSRAFIWVLISVLLSVAFLTAVSVMEDRERRYGIGGETP